MKDLIPKSGYDLVQVDLPPAIRTCVQARDWPALDREMSVLTSPGGLIFERLRAFESFSSIEFIISIRSSLAEPDEDGIWHDDGSRVLAFSLSLTLEPDRIKGGRLEIRRRDAQGATAEIATPSFGTMIVFATGTAGFEHKINRVAQGERVIVAGWCS